MTQYVCHIEAKQAERQLEIASEIQASYGLAISGQASVAYSNNERGSEHQSQVSVFQKGGQIQMLSSLDGLVPVSQQALLDARNGHAYPFAFEVDPYDELALPNDNASFIDIEFARDNLAKLVIHKLALERIENDIDFVRRNQAWFKDPDMATLNATSLLITQEFNTIRQHARTCSQDFVNCVAYTPTYPAFEMPERKEGAPVGNGGQIGAGVGAAAGAPTAPTGLAVLPWNTPVPVQNLRIRPTP